MDQQQTGRNGNAGRSLDTAHARRWLRLRGRRGVILSLTLLVLVACSLWGGVPDARARADQTPLAVVIDTDAGVDDAIAIAWLLAQTERPVEILGFAAVAGNTSVDNAANNVLTLLDAAGRTDIPVVLGAEGPLTRPLSRIGALTHGPDGLWFAGGEHTGELPRDVPAFYDELSREHPRATLIALGPLTNLAQTLARYPDALDEFERIIVLGGGKLDGNRTPVAETNIYIDPESAEIVLASGLPLTMITLDAFEEVTVSPNEIARMGRSRVPVARLIAGPLEFYRQALTMGAAREEVGVPDVAATMYAVDPTRGEEQSALVKVVTDSDLARGQTVIGLTFTERLTMIASDDELSVLADNAFNPDFNQEEAIGDILSREPDNARVVLDVDGKEMQRRLIKALTR